VNYKYFRSIIILVLLCFVFPASAQQTEHDPEKISFGVGVELYPSVLAGDLEARFQAGGFANFIVPIQLGPHILIEPEFGIYAYSADRQFPDTLTTHFDRTIVRTGFGVFYSNEPDKSFEWYLGARLGIMSSEMHTNRSADTSAQWGVFYAGAAFGVEYFFSPHFAIGGEMQLNHIAYGAPIVNEIAWTPIDSVHNVWTTSVSLTARFYF